MADSVGQQLEVGVPDPGDVAPIGAPVVEDRQQLERPLLESQRAQDLVGPGRVLDQQDLELDRADLDSLGAPEGGRDRLEPGDNRRKVDLEREAQRGRAERVVDVVEAREGEGDLCLAGWCAEPEARSTRPVERDALRRPQSGSGASLRRRMGTRSARGGPR